PVDRRFAATFFFPPRVVVRRDGDVREYGVVLNRDVRVLVRLRVRARHDAEIAGFGVDRAQLAVFVEMHPGDVVAERPDLPALLALRRNQHREIGLAAGRWKRAGQVADVAGWALDADDQHVLREPTFGAGLVARDAQCVTFLAEQRVAAITGAVA